MKPNFTFNLLRQIARGFCTKPPQIKPKRMEGKTALIAGAATGIGEATARLFAAHGARVVVADVQEAAGERVAAELGNGAEFIRLDVRNEDEMAAAVDRAAAVAAGNVLDVFHYNAGILGAMGPINELRMEEFDHTMSVNLRGAVLGIKHAARVMKPANKGSIVFTGSVASVHGGLGPHCYSISKSAMVGLVRSTAVELRRFGIRVNMVSPDSVATSVLGRALEALEITADSSLGSAERYVESISLLRGHALGVFDVAHAVMFLACEESGYVSGQNLVVDCGNTVSKANDTAPWFTQTLGFIS
ncbi:hypothetical protein SUGI_1195170 [Cryptomeria japonica]|uniref:short-chain dehydrogenase reductase 3a n=1 Tax=Cryptomeria japonica TaxID=3369 RepID=UPI002414CB75|nr:short-chain dehydrogenase reductase 3a [Cryptomeria japonica]GLJ55647.1 hypothetical protein SUGI_1195170 [Cryptomeria japonica]